MAEIKPAYAGEAMLIRWSENHNGRTVTLQLDPTLGEHHPFKGLKGGLNGQRMQLAAVLIDENEQPQCPKQPSTEPDSPPPVGPSEAAGEGQDTRRTFRNMPRSQQAALKCRDLEFQKWLRDTNPKAYTHVDPDWNEAKCCDHALKLSLVISSKKDLDELPCAAEDWDKIIATFDNRHHIR